MGNKNLVSIFSELARFYTHCVGIGGFYVRGSGGRVLASDRGLGRWSNVLIALVALFCEIVFILGSLWPIGEAFAQNRTPGIQRRLDPQRIATIWKRLGKEPSVLAVQSAVAKRVPFLKARLSSAQRGWLTLVPTRLRFRVYQRDDDDFSDTRFDGDEWRQQVKRGMRVGWHIETEWDFGRWLNDTQWLAVDKARESRRQRRDALVDLATRLYFERRQLQLDYLMRARYIGQDVIRVWVQIHRITAQLDVLTGGLFRASSVVWWEEVARNKGHP